MQAISRIDMKTDTETKLLAERAAAAAGMSLSAYLHNLIWKNAPAVLDEQQRIVMSNHRYDAFIRACETPEAWPRSTKLHAAAEEMDAEGFQWR
ncbi:type II toxin -antitoxin system TacA 1-like antitoxin [Paralysiella testudinis]|uniref:DUF1778 domain-containing protein n=1 Tax=Paralysiella testudinis TaxID=2809020 RepID=A0A892ZM56_9NEIS|nr:DUF1778 domain-containing protein [Paralysiella testudinis]QRQ82867.1 DUF1778 domain-containing protein [Paralysiella testudinis]